MEEILDLMTHAFDKSDLVLKAGPIEARGGDSVRTFTLETKIRTTALLKWTYTAQKALDSAALKGSVYILLFQNTHDLFKTQVFGVF